MSWKAISEQPRIASRTHNIATLGHGPWDTYPVLQNFGHLDQLFGAALGGTWLWREPQPGEGSEDTSEILGHLEAC